MLGGSSIAALETEFAGRGYGDLKAATADAVVAAFGPVRERALELLADPAELDRVLAGNAERADAIARETLARVYDRVGFLPRRMIPVALRTERLVLDRADATTDVDAIAQYCRTRCSSGSSRRRGRTSAPTRSTSSRTSCPAAGATTREYTWAIRLEAGGASCSA